MFNKDGDLVCIEYIFFVFADEERSYKKNQYYNQVYIASVFHKTKMQHTERWLIRWKIDEQTEIPVGTADSYEHAISVALSVAQGKYCYGWKRKGNERIIYGGFSSLGTWLRHVCDCYRGQTRRNDSS